MIFQNALENKKFLAEKRRMDECFENFFDKKSIINIGVKIGEWDDGCSLKTRTCGQKALSEVLIVDLEKRMRPSAKA